MKNRLHLFVLIVSLGIFLTALAEQTESLNDDAVTETPAKKKGKIKNFVSKWLKKDKTKDLIEDVKRWLPISAILSLIGTITAKFLISSSRSGFIASI